MQLPNISQYCESVANPRGLFRSLGEFEAARAPRGGVEFCAGNNAVVFRIFTDRGPRLLKCFLRQGLHTAEIYPYLGCHPDPLTAQVRLLPSEMFVYDTFGSGAYHDVVVAEWIEGVTLETEIWRAHREFGPTRFRELSESFDTMACELLAREWAHGDLKPENIIVTSSGRMRLVDYDAMFLPSMAGRETMEVGTPPFQHPSRDTRFFRKAIDDYSIALISVSLRALAQDASLFRHQRADNILMFPEQILGGTSEAYEEVKRLFATRGDHRSYNLALTLESPTPAIPGLAELLMPARAERICDGPGPRRTEYNPASAIPAQAADVTSGYEAETQNGAGAATEFYTEAQAGAEAEFGTGVGAVVEAGVEAGAEFTPAAGAATNFTPNPGALPSLTECGGKWGYAQAGGAMVIPAIYDVATEFSEEVAVVRLEGSWQAIDTLGEALFIRADAEKLNPFSGGVAAFCREGLWGYLDRRGEVVIEPRFEMAGAMREGRGLVRVAGRYGFIDSMGRLLTECTYDYATGFRDGHATVVSGGETFEIDLHGLRID